MVRLMVTGGGTGGHVYPALTTVREVRRVAAAQQPPADPDVVWIGTAVGLEARIAVEEDMRFRALVAGSCAGRALYDRSCS